VHGPPKELLDLLAGNELGHVHPNFQQVLLQAEAAGVIERVQGASHVCVVCVCCLVHVSVVCET
jgi:hypothetical protein